MTAFFALAAGSLFAGIEIAPIDVSADRVESPLSVSLKRIGTLAPRSVKDIEDSAWTLGCETIERGYADFWAYADYLAPLGIKTIRIQAGWARCEPEPGKFDFDWLDKVIDYACAQGLNVLLETSYGNPVYPVWVDLLTGRVYEFPAKDVQYVDGETFYINVPVYDSPCILTERAALNLLK